MGQILWLLGRGEGRKEGSLNSGVPCDPQGSSPPLLLLVLAVARRVLATAKIIILHMTYGFLFLSPTKNKTAKLTFAQSSLVKFSSL